MSVEVLVEPAVVVRPTCDSVSVSPVAAGITAAERETVPERPILERVTVEAADPPAVKLEGVGIVAVIVNSGRTIIETVVV